jgi:hypothetical protein
VNNAGWRANHPAIGTPKDDGALGDRISSRR